MANGKTQAAAAAAKKTNAGRAFADSAPATTTQLGPKKGAHKIDDSIAVKPAKGVTAEKEGASGKRGRSPAPQVAAGKKKTAPSKSPSKQAATQTGKHVSSKSVSKEIESAVAQKKGKKSSGGKAAKNNDSDAEMSSEERKIEQQSPAQQKKKGAAASRGAKDKVPQKSLTDKKGKKLADTDDEEEGEEEEKAPEQLKPTKPIQPYIYYSTQRVREIKAANPSITHTEATKQAGADWKTLKEDEKAPFVKQAQNDEQRYQKQLQELKTKGYFTMADGTKSTDIEVPNRKKKSSAATPTKGKRKSAPVTARPKSAK